VRKPAAPNGEVREPVLSTLTSIQEFQHSIPRSEQEWDQLGFLFLEIEFASLIPCLLRLVAVLYFPPMIRTFLVTLVFATVTGSTSLALFPWLADEILRVRAPSGFQVVLTFATVLLFSWINGLLTESILTFWPIRWGRNAGDVAGAGLYRCLFCGTAVERVTPPHPPRETDSIRVLSPCPNEACPAHDKRRFFNLRRESALWATTHHEMPRGRHAARSTPDVDSDDQTSTQHEPDESE